MARKEKITPPSKKDLAAAARGMRRGKGPAARVMADAAVAKRQGVKRPRKKP